MCKVKYLLLVFLQSPVLTLALWHSQGVGVWCGAAPAGCEEVRGPTRCVRARALAAQRRDGVRAHRRRSRPRGRGGALHGRVAIRLMRATPR
jgi:hypothetical protein